MRDANRRGFSLIELLIVISVIAILTAIVVPNAYRIRMLAHQHAAMQEIGALHKAIAQYYVQFNRYPESLQELGPPVSGADGPQGANLIPKGLASGHKGGYVFTLTRTTGGYSINAMPEVFGDSGARTYFSDQSMVIHHNETADPATAASPEI